MPGYDLWTLLLGLGAGLACGFLNTAASSGSAVSLPSWMLMGLDPISANATNRMPVLIGGVSKLKQASADTHRYGWREAAIFFGIGLWLGARLAASPAAKKYVFPLLVIVISAELVHLGWHYFFKTQG